MSDSGSHPSDHQENREGLPGKQQACLDPLLDRNISIEMAWLLDISRRSANQRLKIAGDIGASLEPGDPVLGETGTALANAETLVQRWRLRRKLFGAPALFGDPAWEMLVDLFIHECKGKELSISALCVAVGIPMTSALRLAHKLCHAGILRSVRDPIDGRRSIIKLEAATSLGMRAYFEARSE